MSDLSNYNNQSSLDDMNNRYMWLFLLISLMIEGNALAQNIVYAPDTLTREMVLQKEYQPVVHQAEKAFFNPLEETKHKALTPVNFARNIYPVSMNVHPRLFNPLTNPLPSEPVKQIIHARLFGGYPTTVGANIGAMVKTSDAGTLTISLDHLTRYIQTKEDVAYFQKSLDQTHDTDFSLGYTHALEERVLDVGIDMFHHLQTYYGGIDLVDKHFEVGKGTFPLFKMFGSEITFDVSPAPLSLARGWQYSLSGKVGYIDKEDVSTIYDRMEYLFLPSGTEPTKHHNLSQTEVDISGNVGYQFAGSDWCFGLSGRYHVLSITQLNTFAKGPKAPQLLSIDPHFEYLSPSLSVKAGAKLQLINRGKNSFIVTPDIQASYKFNDLFSVYLKADGGTEYMGLKDLYSVNRWADGRSVYNGYDIARYRALLGIKLGSINGFTLDLNGGLAGYSDFSDWGVEAIFVPVVLDGVSTHYNAPIFTRQNKGKVNKSFVNAKARYLAPFGLDLGFRLQYNAYSVLEPNPSLKIGYEETKNNIYGLPALEVDLAADYSFNDRLSLGMSLLLLSGIKVPDIDFISSTGGQSILAKHNLFVVDLGARVSYKVHKNIGLSLIGTNLLNFPFTPWEGYPQQGATGLLAMTLTF